MDGEDNIENQSPTNEPDQDAMDAGEDGDGSPREMEDGSMEEGSHEGEDDNEGGDDDQEASQSGDHPEGDEEEKDGEGSPQSRKASKRRGTRANK